MRRLRKWLRRAAMALVAVLILLVGVYAARGPLFENALIARLQSASAEVLGGKLDVRSVDGNWVTGATLRGVRWSGAEGSGADDSGADDSRAGDSGANTTYLRELQDAEIELDFDLWTLLRGDLSGLTQMQVRVERAVVQCSDESGRESSGSKLPDFAALADVLPGGAELQVRHLELHGTTDAVWQGELQVQIRPRADRAEARRVDMRVGSANVQIEPREDSSLHIHGSVPAVEQFAGLFTAVPPDLHASLEADCVLHPTPSWSLQANGSLATPSGTTARFESVSLPLSDPLQGEGQLQLEFARLAPWLEMVPDPTVRDAVARFGDAAGFLRVRVSEGIATVLQERAPGRPSLTLPGCALRIESATFPIAQPQALRVSLAAELDQSITSLFAVDGAPADLPVQPTGGTVRADLLQRDGIWCMDAVADIAVRDPAGIAGSISGPINLRFADGLIVAPDLTVRGELLRAVDVAQIAGELRVDQDVQLDALTVALSDGGVLEANGTIATSAMQAPDGSWRDVVEQSQARLRLDALALQPLAALIGLSDPGPGTARGALLLAGDASRAQLQFDVAKLVVPEQFALSSTAGSRELGAANVVFDLQLEEGKLAVRSADLQCDALQMQVAGEVEGAGLRQLLADPADLLRSATRGSVRLAASSLERVPMPPSVAAASGGLVADVTLAGSAQSLDVALRFGDCDAAVTLGAMSLAKPSGVLRWREQALELDDLGLLVADSMVRLSGSLRRDAGVLAGELRGKVAGTAAGLEPLALRMKLAGDATQLAIPEFELGNDTLSLRGNGLGVAVSVEELLAAPAKVLERDLRGTVRVDASNLESVAHFWPRLGVRGRASMDVVLAGSLRQFAPTVDLQLANASVRIPDGPRLDEVTGTIRASSGGIVCEQLTASVAGGKLQAGGSYRVDGSLFAFDRPAWRQGTLDLRVDGKDCLVRRRGGVKVRADLDLTATGPLANVQLKGSLRTHSSKLVQRYPYFTLGRVGGAAARQGLLFEGVDLGEHVRVRLDLAVTSREAMKIRSNVVTGDVVLALAIRGTLRSPRLEGTVSMPEGRVLFPGVSFRTANALLQFDRDDPFFPTLSLTGTGRRHGFDVRMVVRGRYDQPEIQLSSTPPLPPEQLAVLVATGSRPEALRTTRAVGAVLGSYLVQELADALFGSESTEAKEGFVSRFEVESGTEISANGTESIVVRFRVVDNVFLEGERDVYEDVNLGIVYRIRFR